MSVCASVDKNTTKFGEWLHLNSLVDTKLSQEVIEVFGYLAYEIVKDVSSQLHVTKCSARKTLYSTLFLSLSLACGALPASQGRYGTHLF